MNILFVCMGNICRSPLAEGIFKDKVYKNHLDIFSDSVGTEYYHVGQNPDNRAIETGLKHNINISKLIARRIKVEDFDNFDKIFVMDSVNYSEVIGIARNKSDIEKVDYILNAINPGENHEVPDPYYGGKEGFEKVFQMLDKACEAIIKQIKPNFE
ncbi:MAG: low molecular weight phosphotyrosine protein phosphatase [Bacteroidetes bacterium]|nr:low molecular weight phosphotyrosine protein phosphatase [Bacteroidota bacterium]